MIKLYAQRIPNESTLVSLTVIDDAEIQNKTKYKVALYDENLNLISFEYYNEYKYYVNPDNQNIISLILQCFDYGKQYNISIERFDDNVNTFSSNIVSIVTLPKSVKLKEITTDDIYLSSTKLPKEVILHWEKAPNNMLGYKIYHSYAEKTSNNWSDWTEVLDNTILPLDTLEYKVKLKYNKDNRFMLTVIDNTVDHNESKASNIVKLLLNNCTILNSYGILKYDYISDITRPVEIDIKEDRFYTKNLQIMLRQRKYQPQLQNYKEIYAYEFMANEKLLKPLTVSIYIELLLNQRYEIRIYKDNKWIQIPCTYNVDDRKITFLLDEIVDFCLCIPDTSLSKYNDLIDTPDKKFAYYTNIMLDKFPVWTKLKQNPVNSIGAAFINVFGIEYDEIKSILDYAIKQQYIETADTNAYAWVYKIIPNYKLENNQIIKLYGDNNILEEVNTLTNFLTTEDTGAYKPKILYRNPFLIDYDENTIYIRNYYNNIKLEVYDINYYYDEVKEEVKPLHSDYYELENHQIWNFIDEFGMLLDLKRLPLESNEHFKDRILDVFINPSNASKEGLMNGIARQLGIRHNILWEDENKPLVIKDSMVILNYIKANDKIIDKKYITFNTNGDISIAPLLNMDIEYPIKVSYVSGLEMHTFWNEKDYIFKNQLYNTDNTASDLFKHYVNVIKNDIPIQWGHFKWNKSYWNIDLKGYGHLPNVFDSNIKGYRKYKNG